MKFIRMKNSISIFLFLLMSTFLFSQNGKLFNENDPLVQDGGMWQYAADPEKNYPKTEEEELEEEGMGGVPSFGLGIPVEFIGFIAENSERSTMAAFSDPDYGFACPNYFTAYKTKKTIEGKFTKTCVVDLEGEQFAIRYKCKKKKNTLFLFYKGKKHPYKRYKF